MRCHWFVLTAVLLSGCSLDFTPTMPRTSPASQIRTGSLTGVVELRDGGVATGATIRLLYREPCFMCSWPGNDTLVGQTTTDSDGQFRFEKIEAKHYVIHIGGVEGYWTWGDFSATVAPYRETRVRYVLTPLEDFLP